MLFELLLLNSFWFWSWIIVFGIVELGFYAHEKPYWGAIWFIFVVAFVTLFTEFNLFVWLFSDWKNIVYTLGGYVLGAVVWSFTRWLWFVYKSLDLYRETKRLYARKAGIDAYFDVSKLVTEDVRDFWEEQYKAFSRRFGVDDPRLASVSSYSGTSSSSRKFNAQPEASDFKEEIITWAAYWPFSIFWTLLADFIHDFAEWIYNRFRGVYQLMSDRVFKSVREDFK